MRLRSKSPAGDVVTNNVAYFVLHGSPSHPTAKKRRGVIAPLLSEISSIEVIRKDVAA